MSSLRIGLTILLLAIVVGVIGVYLYFENIENASVELGTPSGELAFVSNRDGDWDIYLLSSDGMMTNITEGSAEQHDFFPSWSTDGGMINFLTNRVDMKLGPGQIDPETRELKTMTIASAVLETFASQRFNWDPNWSPDGETLLISSLRDRNLELYLTDINGENPQRLTETAGITGPREWFARWSPDGTKIMFLSDRVGEENVFVLDLETDEVTQLTDHSEGSLHPVWSLDGEKILYIYQENHLIEDPSGFVEYQIMNADGSEKRLFGEGEIFEGNPIWSPDGESIVFMSNESGTWSLYLSDRNGENVVRLTDDEGDDLFQVWRP